jgi:6-phosphofructokinase 1
VVVSEGLKHADGRTVFQANDASQQDDCGRVVPGNVSAFLADVVTRNLKIRCRSEKPGLCGRASISHVSLQDAYDAELVGRAAVKAAVEGRDDALVSLRPLCRVRSEHEYDLVPLATAASGGERAFPTAWLNDSDISVSPSFLPYGNAIIGTLSDSIVPLAVELPAASPEVPAE